MKKRFLVSLIVVCVLLPATLSAALVDLSIGATARYDKTFEQINTSIDNEDFGDELKDINNYAFGADVRLKLLLAEVDLVGMFGKETESSVEYTTISVLTSAGISFDILNIARLGLGMGPRFSIYIDKNGNTKIRAIGGALDGQLVDWGNFGEAYIKSPVAYRATLDFNIGNMMLGLNYTVDTAYTFENWQKVGDLFDVPLDSGKVGISFLFSLF